MIRNDSAWLALTDRFQAAAIDGRGWYAALAGLASATGSTSGELISIGANSSVQLNLMTDTSPELLETFIQVNGGDPRVNPRVKAGMESPVLKVMAEEDFLTPDEHKRHPHYNEFARPFDIPYICLTTLERHPQGLIGLAVNRTQKQGHITRDERRVFEMMAPHVRAAVRTHIALEGKGDALVCGALDAISAPAFICDSTGRVRQHTAAADAIVTSGRGLQLRLGRLSASLAADSQALNDAIERAVSDSERVKIGPPRNSLVVVRRSERDTEPLVLEVIVLPERRFEFTFEPRVLVLVRGVDVGGSEIRLKAILQSAYGMTAAETQIALHLLAGQSPEKIAAGRAVSVETVRTQIKTVLAKAGVRRQVELVARLSQL